MPSIREICGTMTTPSASEKISLGRPRKIPHQSQSFFVKGRCDKQLRWLTTADLFDVSCLKNGMTSFTLIITSLTVLVATGYSMEWAQQSWVSASSFESFLQQPFFLRISRRYWRKTSLLNIFWILRICMFRPPNIVEPELHNGKVFFGFPSCT